MDDTREFQIQLIYDGPMVSRGRIPAIAVGEGIVGMAKMVSRAGNILARISHTHRKAPVSGGC